MGFDKESKDGSEQLEINYVIKDRKKTDIKLDVTRFPEEDKVEVEIRFEKRNEVCKTTLTTSCDIFNNLHNNSRKELRWLH